MSDDGHADRVFSSARHAAVSRILGISQMPRVTPRQSRLPSEIPISSAIHTEIVLGIYTNCIAEPTAPRKRSIEGPWFRHSWEC